MAVTAPLTLPYAHVQFKDGQPFSPDDNDIYFPGHARMQTETVFLAGNHLPQRWQGRSDFTIVETGFGSGQNFLATWAAWRADPSRCQRLSFVSFDHRPWHIDDLQRCHADGPHQTLAAALIEQWPLPCRGPHLRHFEGGRVSLLLWFDDVTQALPLADIPFDACYLDGFSPDRNPTMWSPSLLQALARQARPGATLASYSVAATVRHGLTATGAVVQRMPGLHKRKVLHGVWPNSGLTEGPTAKSVAVLGAGLAGCSVATALARSGVDVTVFDPATQIASGASAAPRMVVRRWRARQPTPASDLSLLGFLHAVAAYRGHPAWQPCGVQQPSKPGDAPSRMIAALAEQAWPAELMRRISPADANPAWFEASLGGALDARAWCASQLDHPRIDLRLGQSRPLARLRDEFDAVVIACATATPEVLGQPMPMTCIRGQTTTLMPGSLPPLKTVRCGDGYVSPLADGAVLVGATYERDDNDSALREESHAENLQRLQRLTGESRSADQISDGWVGFRAAWPDRLPALGAVDDSHQTWIANGYASRGAVWAPLLGEVLAALILQRPVPLPRDLLQTLHPARLTRRKNRRNRDFPAAG